MSIEIEKVKDWLQNSAMDLACQAIIPNYSKDGSDLPTVAALMIDLGEKKEGIIFPKKFGFEDNEHADKLFRMVAHGTFSIYNYLVQGASLMLEYGTLEKLSMAELEELVDEL